MTSWHVDPEYQPVACTHCMDHMGRPTGVDPDYGGPCRICHGRKYVDPDRAPEPGETED